MATEQAGVAVPGNMVVSDDKLFFVNTGGRLRWADVVPGANPWFGSLDASVGGVGIVNGLAALGGHNIAGGGPGIGKLFAYSAQDGLPDAASELWSWGSLTPTSGPAVGTGSVFTSVRTGADELQIVRVDKLNGALLAQSSALPGSSFSGNGVATPTLGEGNRLYALDDAGDLFVLSQTFASSASADWTVALPAALTSPVLASPALDCNRRRANSESGVIYIATENGWLVSYIIDSKGLDPMAPWPKYARDARNTGNFNGPAIGCP